MVQFFYIIRVFFFIQKMIDKRMIKFMNQRRQIFFTIHGQTFFIHVITHNGENLFLMSFYLPVCSIVPPPLQKPIITEKVS